MHIINAILKIASMRTTVEVKQYFQETDKLQKLVIQARKVYFRHLFICFHKVKTK